MSVDITGSMLFKQIFTQKNATLPFDELDEGMPSEPWLSPTLEFYEQISTIFDERWRTIGEHAQGDPHAWAIGERPTLWKVVGDELIFTKVLTDHRQAYICVTAWLQTAQEYRKRIKQHSVGLDLKCAAWLAGFPVNNAEVILDHQAAGGLVACDKGDYIFGNLSRLHAAANQVSDAGNAHTRDFIGPSIDTGFRVGSVASPRRFVLSVDLALVLAHTLDNLPGTWGYGHLQLYYEGRKDLKGVTNGTPYPIFWVNAATPDPLMTIEDEIENRTMTPASRVKEFCEQFFEKNKGTHLMRPFILDDPDDFFRRVPPLHAEKLNKLARYWKSESARRMVEEPTRREPACVVTLQREPVSSERNERNECSARIAVEKPDVMPG
ncbi:hypothetical protein QS306_13195 [Paraburkholderia bonniea]|uniref:hypothetical protein n=1 Tax=Paraburkholderia bonniea TaxID=2152891 RepID=UPI0012912F83|nr:hypothetical protein [Paraburkholderia bonniea]WJF90036.1 hypothetical protein QS306_13195 [Paraburkholderia bonniea]WJF93350.1 hypothetical protein QS308_13205 [Paraburkholderia bonniea]